MNNQDNSFEDSLEYFRISGKKFNIPIDIPSFDPSPIKSKKIVIFQDKNKDKENREYYELNGFPNLENTSSKILETAKV